MRITHLSPAVLRVLRGVGAALALGGHAICAPALARLAEPTASPLPFPAEDRDQAIACLSTAIVREAGHEPREGQQAVAQVIMNRVRALGYPKTVCGVIFQGSARATGCQFTFTCDGSMRRPISMESLRNVQDIAEMALSGDLPNRVADATHYHANYVSPAWSHTLTRVGQIGAHIFYRSGGGLAPGQTVNMLSFSGGGRPAPILAATPAKPFLPWGLGIGSGLDGTAATATPTQP